MSFESVTIPDDKQKTNCGSNVWIQESGDECSVWRYEDVRNSPSKCIAWEISTIWEWLHKSPETQEERFDTAGIDHSHSHEKSKMTER